MLDDVGAQDQVERALRRQERRLARLEKRKQNARRLQLMQEAALRDLEARRCVEMKNEDELSRLAQLCYEMEEKAEMELRRKVEEEKLLTLLTTARKTAKSAGVASLSTQGLRGIERLTELKERTSLIEQEKEARKIDSLSKLRLRYDKMRARTTIGVHTEKHSRHLMSSAIMECKWEAMFHLITTSGITPDFETLQGFTPLVMALSHTRPSIARRLLDAGASINYETISGKTPLLAAILADDLDSVHLLISRGVDIRAESKDGVTPLLLAIDKGRSEITKVLLEALGDKIPPNSMGITPLLQATYSQQAAIAKILFAHGGVISDRNVCVQLAKRCLFNAFADLLEALHFQIHSLEPQEISHDNDENTLASSDIKRIIKLVSTGGIGPNYEDRAGRTPLIVAASIGTLSDVEVLLALGSIASHQTRRGSATIQVACSRGASDIITCLVNAGASLTVVDLKGNDSFHYLREYPEQVERWTKVRPSFSKMTPLGIPIRAGAIARHGVPTYQTKSHVDDIRISLPHEGNQYQSLAKSNFKVPPSVINRGRRNAVSVTKRDGAYKLCDNCLHVRATTTCVECIMAFCDRCVMERHYGRAYHHHNTAPLVEPQQIPVKSDDGFRGIEGIKDVLGAIRETLKLPNNQTSGGDEEIDEDIRKRIARKKAAEEIRLCDETLTINIPKLAARQCQEKGEHLFDTPSELFLARNYVNRGLWDKAYVLFETVRQIQSNSLGSKHPQSRGELGDADGLLLEALNCFAAAFPCNNAEVLTTIADMLACWSTQEAQKKYADAAAFCHVTEATRRSALGDDHDLTIQARTDASIYLSKWEMLQMFLQDSVGQRLADEIANATYYSEAKLGRLPELFLALLASDALPIFTSYCSKVMHGDNLAFWLAVEHLKATSASKSIDDVRTSAKHIFDKFIKKNKIQCTTVAVRNRVRAFLRNEPRSSFDAFESAQILVFNTLYSSVYLAFLDTSEGKRCHAEEIPRSLHLA
ncbi:unnamed protein product [Aphanomyces euteiches]